MIRHLTLISLVIAQIACSGNEQAKDCTADCNGLLASNPQYSCVLWDQNQYESGTVTCEHSAETNQCEINTQSCKEIEIIERTSVGPYETCNGKDIVCSDDYTCTRIENGSYSLCLKPCGDSSQCNDGEYCDFDTIVFRSFGLCWPRAETNAACLPAATPGSCLDSNAECLPNGVGLGGECRVACSGEFADIQGENAGCSEDEWCLSDQSNLLFALEHQLDENNYQVFCKDNPSVCNEEEKYTCRHIYTSNFQQPVCARKSGRCGHPVAIQTSLNPENYREAALSNDALCNKPFENTYCQGFSETEGVNAVPSCEDLNWGIPSIDAKSEESFSCTSYADCMLFGTDCIEFENGSFCGSNASVCVAYCETTTGEAELTCPEGLSCKLPSADEMQFDFVFQTDEAYELIECATNDDCTDGYKCDNYYGRNIKTCGRPRKICAE